MDILIQAAQLILSLSILVILHELGHFIPAKLFKTRVEKFYLFFDPWFSLFKFKKGDTEYGVGWLPLGGYVKISGMIDESMDTEQMKEPAQPWEFRSKPAWQRLIIMVGGVVVNVILGVVIYAGVLFAWGDQYIPTENLTYGIYADSMAVEMGLQNGDKILTIDGDVVEKFNDIPLKILLENAKTIEIVRQGETTSVAIPDDTRAKMIRKQTAFIQPALIPVVAQVTKGSNAEKAGLMLEDKIVGINNSETPFFQDVVKTLGVHKGETINLVVTRNGERVDLTAEVSSDGKLGFGIKPQEEQLVLKTEKYGLLESVPAGINKAYEKFESYLKQMKLIADPDTEAYKSLGGFITIGKAFDTEWNWYRFWNFTAFLSIILAIMNILPIPALDGGHVMFLVYEIITGRKPHDKVMEYAQIAGIIILLGLMLLANGNDILRLFQ
ncbi:MAG: RIP metalloprotease RseP [Flavobacteriales bacterium]|nr:RIP metalloprotease RseP [Flavobacteriales bacterium]